MPVTKPLEAKQERLHTGLDVNIEFQEGASIEVLFTRNEVIFFIIEIFEIRKDSLDTINTTTIVNLSM